MPVYTPKKFYTGQPGTTATTLYTAPASTKSIIKNIIVCNTTANAANLTISLVPSGGSASAANRIMSSLNINAYDTVPVDLSGVLDTGDFLSAQQGTSSALTVHISGLEVV